MRSGVALSLGLLSVLYSNAAATQDELDVPQISERCSTNLTDGVLARYEATEETQGLGVVLGGTPDWVAIFIDGNRDGRFDSDYDTAARRPLTPSESSAGQLISLEGDGPVPEEHLFYGMSDLPSREKLQVHAWEACRRAPERCDFATARAASLLRVLEFQESLDKVYRLYLPQVLQIVESGECLPERL